MGHPEVIVPFYHTGRKETGENWTSCDLKTVPVSLLKLTKDVK